jgi:cytochrome P450
MIQTGSAGDSAADVSSRPQPRRYRRPPPAPIPEEREFGRLELLLRLRDNPLTLWRGVHFREPVVAGRGVLGYGVVVSDPAGIRRILVENVANYRKDALQRAVLAPGLGEGLLTAEGEAWKRARRTLAPLFTPRRVEALARRMLPPIEARVASLRARRPGHILDIGQEMTRVTYDVLAETLFSSAIAGGAAEFGAALTRYFETQGRIDPLDVMGAPRWLPRLGRIRARPAIRFFETRVRDIIEQRRDRDAAMEAAGEGASREPDLLSALLRARDPETGEGLSELEVGANIITFIGAGHETTANALTWTIYLLSTDPEVRATVEQEVDGVGPDLASAVLEGRLPWTRAVLEESMRLYPPVATLTRAAVEPDVVAGTAVPKSSLVVISPYVLHRHALLWRDPAQFRPERFLPGAREEIPRFGYLPFGAGPRICIGQQFAMIEAVLVLASILRAFRLDHAGAEPPRPVQRITLRPRGGMPMRIVPRH